MYVVINIKLKIIIIIKKENLSTDKQPTSWSNLFHHDDNTTPVSQRSVIVLYSTTVTSYRLDDPGFESWQG